MGFLNKLLKGLGFEEEETAAKQVKIKKVKKEKVKSNNSGYAAFDLNEEDRKNDIEEEKNVNSEKITEEDSSVNGNFSIIKVKSQIEVQGIVDKIKNGERILINLTGMSGVDITRSLDFLTGAVYALDKTMQKVDGNVYLIQ